MKKSEGIDNSLITFKKGYLIILLIAIAIPLFNGFFSNSLDVGFLVSSILGVGIATPFTYYILNHKSFDPMPLPKFALTMVFNIVVSSIIALAASYIISLF